MTSPVARYIFSILIVLGSLCTSSAQSLQMVLHRTDTAGLAAPPLPERSYTTVQELITQLRKSVPEWQSQGYLAASIDSIGISGSRYDVYYYLGQQYFWAELLLDSIPPAMLPAASIDEKQFSGKPLNPAMVSRLSGKLLQYCEENGYPFARVWLSEISETKPGHVRARLRVDRAELRRIDTIIINGNVKVAASFLSRYLDILQGSVYHEKKLRMISQRLMELPFLQEYAPWVMSFRPGDTRLSLFLKEKKANQLNALLGLMPNNLQTGKLLLTADVQLALQNLLAHGESISASYQNLQARSPRMKADIVVPYLFASPLGAEVHFDLFRNDLLFRKVSFQAGIRYQLSSADYLRLYYQVLSNRVIEIDSASILATRTLPANIDVRSNGVGFELVSNRTDYRLNPRKGVAGRAGMTASRRKVLPNDAVSGLDDGSGFDFGSLYDTLTKPSYQYHFTADLAGYIPLGRALTLKLGYVGGYIASPNIFQNELFQVGGFRLLRGFDEQSIFASQYHISVTELRLRLGLNSYVYLFSDNGWVQTRFSNYNREGLYNGFGMGTTLETKNGLFSIALAFGRSDHIPLRFRESKISFGYVALF